MGRAGKKGDQLFLNEPFIVSSTELIRKEIHFSHKKKKKKIPKKTFKRNFL